MTKKQIKAKKRIAIIRGKMEECWDTKYLSQLFEEAENIWYENFPFEANNVGDNWYLKRRYHDLCKEIRKRGNININLFGCNLNFKTV